MMTWIVVVAWVVSAVASYFIVRYTTRRWGSGWTLGCRLYWLPVCAICGPMTLLACGVVLLIIYTATVPWMSREARW